MKWFWVIGIVFISLIALYYFEFVAEPYSEIIIESNETSNETMDADALFAFQSNLGVIKGVQCGNWQVQSCWTDVYKNKIYLVKPTKECTISGWAIVKKTNILGKCVAPTKMYVRSLTPGIYYHELGHISLCTSDENKAGQYSKSLSSIWSRYNWNNPTAPRYQNLVYNPFSKSKLTQVACT